MPGAFCKDSTVFISFCMFCSSFSSAICIVSICSLCRCNYLSDSSFCIPRFYRIFLIFLKSAIFLHSLPLLHLLSHFIFISIILSDHLSYLVCWDIDISQILPTFPFCSISLYFMYAYFVVTVLVFFFVCFLLVPNSLLKSSHCDQEKFELFHHFSSFDIGTFLSFHLL